MTLQFVDVPEPGNQQAREVLARYEKYMAMSPEQQAKYMQPGRMQPGWLTLLLCVFLPYLTWSIIMGYTVSIVFAAVMTIAFAAVNVLTLVRGRKRRSPVREYDEQVARGTITAVPQVVIDAVQQRASQIDGLTSWDEYDTCLYLAYRDVMAEVGPRLQLLADECKCGNPQTCSSIQHISEDNRRAIGSEVDEAAYRAVTSMADMRRQILQGRADYNRAIGGQWPPLPQGEGDPDRT